ncbi:MAG: Bax inhibitor-1/YccA family protein [Defluviitaleaceae bacterium]|nr:Bax inhibitor-1/YccA family protein [Defluviitaleaceae bacterium]
MRNYDDYDSRYRRDILDANPRHSITEDDVHHFMRGVFGWMFLGLLITTVTSLMSLFALYSIPAVAENFFMLTIMFVVAQFGIVFALSGAIHKLSLGVARMMFVVYSALTGFTLSFIFIVYAADTIFLAFAMAAVFFGIMAVFGYTTQSDLSSAGRIFFIGLIAIIIAMVINFFLGSSQLDFLISIAGIAVFSGLTAYHVQRLKSEFIQNAVEGGPEVVGKLSILGALSLYLAFINLFLFLLRILGRRD